MPRNKVRIRCLRTFDLYLIDMEKHERNKMRNATKLSYNTRGVITKQNR